MFAMIY